MNPTVPEQVPFELLHLELVSQIIHKDVSNIDDATAISKLELMGNINSSIVALRITYLQVSTPDTV